VSAKGWRRWGGRLVTLLTIAGIGVTLLPYFWMLSSSLKTASEVFELPIRWLPREPQWSNYPAALSRGAFGVYFFNSSGDRGDAGQPPLLHHGRVWPRQVPVPVPGRHRSGRS
jgi:hypothetical protein